MIMVDMARLLFAVICDQYFDDYMIVDIASGGASAQNLLGLCHDLVGQSLEPKKRQLMATGNKGLGQLIFMGNVHTEYAVWISCTADRRDKVLAMLAAARDARHLSPADASTIRGKLGFLLTAAWAKVGRAATQPLLQREYYDVDYGWSPALEAAAQFFEALLPDLPALLIPITPDRRPPVVLYTDAMFRRRAGDPTTLHRDPRGVPISRLGIVVRDSMTGVDRHSDQALPPWVFDYLSPTDHTLVMQAEMIAPIAALLSRPPTSQDVPSCCSSTTQGRSHRSFTATPPSPTAPASVMSFTSLSHRSVATSGLSGSPQRPTYLTSPLACTMSASSPSSPTRNGSHPPSPTPPRGRRRSTQSSRRSVLLRPCCDRACVSSRVRLPSLVCSLRPFALSVCAPASRPARAVARVQSASVRVVRVCARVQAGPRRAGTGRGPPSSRCTRHVPCA